MILITGGTGYLGGRLAKYLSNLHGLQIVVTKREESVDISESIPNCDIRVMDIMNTNQIKETLEGITDVIHLISPNAKDSYDNPEVARRINVEGTKNLLYECKQKSIKRFIYFSTAHVYGSPLSGHIDENNITNPSHPYALTHLEAERVILEESYALNIVPTILRLSNAVGPPIIKGTDCWMLVVNDIVRQIITKEKMEFRSQKQIERDYIAIDQICYVLEIILSSSKTFPGIYNLGSGKSISLEDLAKLIGNRALKLLGINAKLSFPSSINEVNYKLTYSTEKIEKAGILIDNNLEKEIDQLLSSSYDWFSKES